MNKVAHFLTSIDGDEPLCLELVNGSEKAVVLFVQKFPTTTGSRDAAESYRRVHPDANKLVVKSLAGRDELCDWLDALERKVDVVASNPLQ